MSASIGESVSSESISSDRSINGAVDSAGISGSPREEVHVAHDEVVTGEGKLTRTSGENQKGFAGGLCAISRGIAARFLPRGRVTKPTDSQSNKPPPK